MSDCFFISLQTRPDRTRQFLIEASKFKFRPIRIFATTHDKPFMGCTKSHIRALEKSLIYKWEWIFIFEDDFQFKLDPWPTINEFKQTRGNVLMLQVNPLKLGKSKGSFKTVLRGLSTAGYMVRYSYIPKLLKNFRSSLMNEIPLDVGMLKLQNDKTWFTVQPPIGIQRPGYSDIEKRFVNYGI